MDEDKAKRWLTENLNVSRETFEKLDSYVAMLLEEGSRQNLISKSTFETIWTRHIVDSAQLIRLADQSDRSEKWLDLGSGAGLPGIVLAILSRNPVVLVESRARRIEFLKRCVDQLSLADHAKIEGRRLEVVDAEKFDFITARAFAPLPKLFDSAHRFAKSSTVWILPKGKSVEDELGAVNVRWQADFETVQSVTNEASSIVVARNVCRRR